MDPLAVSAYGAEQALPLTGTGTGGSASDYGNREALLLMFCKLLLMLAKNKYLVKRHIIFR